MSLEEDILIENFLEGKLTKSEQEDFSLKMDNDAYFREKVMLEKQLAIVLNDRDWSFAENENSVDVKDYKELLENKESIELKSILKNVNETYKNTNKSSSFLKWILYSSAAFIAIFLSLYLLMQPNATNKELYANYIDLSEMPSLVTRSDSSENDLLQAQKFFENKNYSEALQVFNKVQETENATLLLYKGISQMQLDKFKEAEITFNTLIKSDLIDAQKGYWYKALLYLKKDELEKSRAILKNIISSKYYNFDKADILMKDLQ